MIDADDPDYIRAYYDETIDAHETFILDIVNQYELEPEAREYYDAINARWKWESLGEGKGSVWKRVLP